MIIESGIIIFMSYLLLVWWLPKEFVLREILGHPFRTDLIASALAYIMHAGTVTGVLAAAVASLCIHTAISICRWFYGHIEKDPETKRMTYYVGHWDLLKEIPYTER